MDGELQRADASTGPTDAQLLDVLLAGLGLSDEPDSLWWEPADPGDSLELDDALVEDADPVRQVRSAGAAMDPLKDYLKQIGKTALLSATEEIELARRIEAGLLADEVLAEANRLPLDQILDLGRLSEEGRRAKDQMVCANLRLVVSIARRYQRHGLELPDLVQEGNLGLNRAVEKFDHTMGNKFSTYATWWIKQAITRALADQARTIRIPVHMVEVINKVMRTSRQSGERLGYEPSDAEVAVELGMTAARVGEAKMLAKRIFSLSEPLTSDSDYREYWLDGDNRTVELQWLLVEDDPLDECGAIEEWARRDVVTKVLESLEGREAAVLSMRFGLSGDEPMTLEDIGHVFGVTRERIRQIEKKALQKLREPALASDLLAAWIDGEPALKGVEDVVPVKPQRSATGAPKPLSRARTPAAGSQGETSRRMKRRHKSGDEPKPLPKGLQRCEACGRARIDGFVDIDDGRRRFYCWECTSRTSDGRIEIRGPARTFLPGDDASRGSVSRAEADVKRSVPGWRASAGATEPSRPVPPASDDWMPPKTSLPAERGEQKVCSVCGRQGTRDFDVVRGAVVCSSRGDCEARVAPHLFLPSSADLDDGRICRD